MKKTLLIGAGIVAVAGFIVGIIACNGRPTIRIKEYIDPRGGKDDELASEFLRNQPQR